jgi:hypothetical protein
VLIISSESSGQKLNKSKFHNLYTNTHVGDDRTHVSGLAPLLLLLYADEYPNKSPFTRPGSHSHTPGHPHIADLYPEMISER